MWSFGLSAFAVDSGEARINYLLVLLPARYRKGGM
jgi:hypothetical protein